MNDDTSTIERGKKLIRAQAAGDLKAKLDKLRKENPQASMATLWQRLREQEPELFKYSAKIENGDWEPGAAEDNVPSGEPFSKRTGEKPSDPRIGPGMARQNPERPKDARIRAIAAGKAVKVRGVSF